MVDKQESRFYLCFLQFRITKCSSPIVQALLFHRVQQHMDRCLDPCRLLARAKGNDLNHNFKLYFRISVEFARVHSVSI